MTKFRLCRLILLILITGVSLAGLQAPAWAEALPPEHSSSALPISDDTTAPIVAVDPGSSTLSKLS
ncbi:MAG TPA: hypothetical protein VK832_19185, partial [Burkholderiaceae bacterium]|nr:hypothetical protein [Burkholderiaceae bacterium]